MHSILKLTGSLVMIVLLAAGMTGCSKEDDPVAAVVNNTFTFEVASAAVNTASAYLQSVDLITYTASGGGTVNQQVTSASLPWNVDATVAAGAGAGLSISYSTTLIDPTAAARMGNTQFIMTIKKDSTTVKTETKTITSDDPQHSITWTE